MINSYKSTEFKARPTTRFEKFANPVCRNPSNFAQRSFSSHRRRMMSGRYPNTGIRQFSEPQYRQNFPAFRGVPPVRDFRHQLPSPNPRFPTTTEICPLPQQPRPNVPNVTDNKSICFPFPPRPPTMFNYNNNNNSNQNTVESPEYKTTHLKGVNLNAEVWVEAFAPHGKVYYYNARTHHTTWERPINVQIVSLDQAKHIVFNSPQEHYQNVSNQNPGPVMKSATYNPCINTFFSPPVNVPTSTRFTRFPPTPPMYSTPRIFSPSNDCVRSPIVDFKFTIPPPVFPPPVVPKTPSSLTQIFNNQTNFSPSNSKAEISEQDTKQPNSNNESFSKETKISDWSITDSNPSEQIPCVAIPKRNKISKKREEWCASASKMLQKMTGHIVEERKVSEKMKNRSISDSKISLQITDNAIEKNKVSEKMEEDVLENDNKVNNVTSKCESQVENESTEMKKCENTIMMKEKTTSEEAEGKELKKEVMKSRPKSSTPVAGTPWCIVWTNDEKVFFYNPQQKISIWTRPEELNNRADVDKLIEKPPLLLNTNIRNTTSLGPDVKKLKQDIESTDETSLSEKQSKIVEEVSKKPANMAHEEKIKIFRKMLTENNVSAFSAWEKELPKIINDSRYQLLPSKERRQVYETFILEKLEEEKTCKQKDMEQRQKQFLSLLEEANITAKTRFTEFAYRYAKDGRFKSAGKMKLREDMFNQYVSEIRERGKLEIDHKKICIELLQKKDFLKNASSSEIKSKIPNDKRQNEIRDNSSTEKVLNKCIPDLSLISEIRNKEDRANTSIKNREEQVKRDLSIYLKDREREQELHKYKTAVSDFKALLNDLIRQSNFSWHSAKKKLQEDRRWEYVLYLDPEERQELFNNHIELLNLKKKEGYRRLLDEISTITLTTLWKDVRKIIFKDPRCLKFSSSERKCEKEFKEYLKDRMASAKVDFKQLLKETKSITYKSKLLLNNTKHLRDIENALSKDKRYLILDCVRNERKEILLSYIDELHSVGPPPPPTATSSNRSAKNY